MTKETLSVSSAKNASSCLSAVMYTELCMCRSVNTYGPDLCRCDVTTVCMGGSDIIVAPPIKAKDTEPGRRTG